MDPTQPYDPHECFEDAIIYQLTLKNGQGYEGSALSKARAARRCRMSTSEIIVHCPELLEKGDTIYPGGVYDKGLVVAVSSTNPEFDELFARTIIKQCRVIVRLQMDTIRESTIEYLGEKTVVIVCDECMQNGSLSNTTHYDLGDLKSVIARSGCKSEILAPIDRESSRIYTVESCKEQFSKLKKQDVIASVLVIMTPCMFSNSPGLIPFLKHIIQECVQQDEGGKKIQVFPLISVMFDDSDEVTGKLQSQLEEIINAHPALKYLRELEALKVSLPSDEEALHSILQSCLQR